MVDDASEDGFEVVLTVYAGLSTAVVFTVCTGAALVIKQFPSSIQLATVVVGAVEHETVPVGSVGKPQAAKADEAYGP